MGPIDRGINYRYSSGAALLVRHRVGSNVRWVPLHSDFTGMVTVYEYLSANLLQHKPGIMFNKLGICRWHTERVEFASKSMTSLMGRGP